MALVTAVSKKHTLVANVASKVVDASLSRLHLVVTADAAVVIGGSDVSYANGFPLTAGQTVPIPANGCQAELWALATAAYDVTTLEFVPL